MTLSLLGIDFLLRYALTRKGVSLSGRVPHDVTIFSNERIWVRSTVLSIIIKNIPFRRARYRDYELKVASLEDCPSILEQACPLKNFPLIDDIVNELWSKCQDTSRQIDLPSSNSI